MRTIIAMLVLAAASPAGAQPAQAEAEILFRQGKQLMAQGKLAEACAAFHESQKLEPTVATLLNEANCREKHGELATAWGLFLEAERQTRVATDDDTRSLHRVALERSSKLEPRVSKLTISVSADSRIDRLEIARGEDALGEASWNRALPIDGGTYRIVARAPGATAWSTEITIAPEGDTKTIDVPRLQSAAPPPRRTDTVPRTTSARHSRIAPVALGIGAAVLLGGAFGADRWARSTYDRAQAELDPATQDSLWRDANRRRYAADGLAIAGAGCAAVAVWLYLRGHGEASPPPATARAGTWILEPIAGRGGAGIAITARYR